MKRRDFLRGVAGTAGVLAAGSRWAMGQGTGAPRPNIVWLTCEDMSPHLGCYGYRDVRTPVLDRFAAESVRYTRCFSVSGVCAPSRSCLITGMYPSSLGTHHMRCSNPPAGPVRCFSTYLRDAGYYCTNNSKTDYNFPVPEDAWDESSGRAHWRNRPDPEQPFFAVFNHTGTHERPTGHLPEDGQPVIDDPHDPSAITLPPYFPDTPVVRRHWAHYLDLITVMDGWVGDRLRELDEAGLADNTVVFFFSDHGTGLPRMKRWLYDSGLHVPLMVRWPGQIAPGTVDAGLVSFVDFAPTVLTAAGIEPPDHLHGQPFLGAGRAQRAYVYAARDRMDERYDIIRAVRDERFKYIRNYEPYRPYAQYLTYPEGMPVMQELRRVHSEGGLNADAALFFRDRKPPEELYDTESDPHELNNLAEAPAHRDTLTRLRHALDVWMADHEDLGLVPEIELAAWLRDKSRETGLISAEPHLLYRLPAAATGRQIFGRDAATWLDPLNGRHRLARLRGIHALGRIGAPCAPLLAAALDDDESAVAYWAAVSLGEADIRTEAAMSGLRRTLKRAEPAASLAAARALVQLGAHEEGLPLLIASMNDPNPYARLFAAETLESVAHEAPAALDALHAALEDENQYVVRIAARAVAMS